MRLTRRPCRVLLCGLVGIAFADSLSLPPPPPPPQSPQSPQPQPKRTRPQWKPNIESLQQTQQQKEILLLMRRWSSHSSNTTPEHAYEELFQFQQQCSLFIDQYSWEAPTLAVLKLCYRHFSTSNDKSMPKLRHSESYSADWAYSVWQTMCPESLAARHVVLQIYGQQLQQHLAKDSFQQQQQQLEDTRHTTTILWNQILQLVSLSDHPNIFTTNVALLNSALAAAPTGQDALWLYQQTQNTTTTQWTTLSYNLVLKKLTPDLALKFLETNMIPAQAYNRQSLEIIARASSLHKKSNITVSQRLRQLCMACCSSSNDKSTHNPMCCDLFPSKVCQEKRPPWPEHILQRWNDGKFATHTPSMKHFVVATMGSLTLTAQPNRQSHTDLRLILWNTTNPHQQRQKVGYMLLTTAQSNDTLTTTTTTTTTSSLMGVYLDPNYRQHGLSKQFISAWIQLCRRAQLVPRTEIIRKPLLCLVLQHSFGFVPFGADKNTEGVDIEVYPPQRDDDDNDACTNQIRVYSSTRCLEGIFSPWDVQREHLSLCVQRPSNTMGRTIRIHGRFVLSPTKATVYADRLLEASHANDSGEWHSSLTETELRTILIGEDSNHKM